MTIRQRLRRRCVLDAVRMGREIIAGRDLEAMGLPAAATKSLRGQRIDHGDKRHIRLLTKGETQPHFSMRCQVADEWVRQRLVVFLRFLHLSLGCGSIAVILVAVFDNLAITSSSVSLASKPSRVWQLRAFATEPVVAL